MAHQNAAIATLNQGFERFIIDGYGVENNTRVVTTGPTYSNTTGTFNRVGSSVYGRTNTTYGGQMVTVAGHNDAQLRVIMLNPGDDGFDEGIDARQPLGPDWQKKVSDGVNTCF